MSWTLVTGASGLIGVNLVRALALTNCNLRVLLRSSSSREGLAGFRVEEAHGDIMDYPSVRRAMEGVDRVYHVAGRVCMGPFQAHETHNINVIGTRNVCLAAIDAGVKRLVYTSTVSTIGQGSAENPADESSVFNSPRINSPYYRSKREAEVMALNYCAANQLEVVVVNPSVVLGPWDIKPSSGKILTVAVKLGGYLAYPLGVINVVDVGDVVAGHIGAMDLGRAGHRYILGNETLSHRDFFTMIAEVAGLRRPIIPFNRGIALPLVAIGDLLGPWFPNAFENFNSLLANKMQERQFVSVAKARSELRMTSTPVRLAIASAIRWFRETGRIQGATERSEK